MKKILFLSSIVLLSTGCSSYFVRKDCEKVNWFQHAYNVAMEGKRLPEDDRIRACEKAETDINAAELDRGFKAGMENYCKPQSALDKGAKGDAFNYDFCDSNVAPALRAKHVDGMKRFCTPANAYTFASLGGIYKNQCTKNEDAWMVKYRQGRQVFLRGEINKNEGAIAGLESEIREQQHQRNQLNTRLALMPKSTVATKQKEYNAATRSYTERTVLTEDPSIKRQREDVEWEIRSTTNKIQEKQDEQRKLREDNAKLSSELDGLKGS